MADDGPTAGTPGAAPDDPLSESPGTESGEPPVEQREAPEAGPRDSGEGTRREERRETDAPSVRASRRESQRSWLDALAEQPEIAIEMPRQRLASQSRRDFLLFAAGALASVVGAWWLLPDRTKARLLPGSWRKLDTLASRVGLSPDRRERVLNGALTFDDDVAEALFSRDRRVRTYARSDAVSVLRNNYHGRTPGPEYLSTWQLQVSGLASGRSERLSIESLISRFHHHEQVTRLVCVEGWSAIAWWGGLRFADFLAAFPPAPEARWAAMRSAVSLDARGAPETYYVSLDLETARHPQTLLATHLGGQPLDLAHGAPLRLLAPMKLGLKNIKAVTDIEYTIEEPPDYWAKYGYSRYDGL